MTLSVSWPAMLKYAGDDELVYVSDANEWLEDSDLSGCHYDESDVLVDSEGRQFALTGLVDGVVTPVVADGRLNSAQVADLLKSHFSVTGACCVSTLQAVSIAEYLEMLHRDQQR